VKGENVYQVHGGKEQSGRTSGRWNDVLPLGIGATGNRTNGMYGNDCKGDMVAAGTNGIDGAKVITGEKEPKVVPVETVPSGLNVYEEHG